MRVGALYAILRLETGAFHSALGRAESRWSRFGGFLKAGGLLAAQGIAVVGAASLAMAGSFEKHMNESLAIMSGVTDEMRDRMEAAARDIAKHSTFSANEAADAFFYLAGAGYDANQSIAALPVVTQFAQAGVMDLERATELLMNAQSSMGLKVDDAQQNMLNMTRVSDVLTAAQIESTATLEQMSEALINKAAPALRLVNKDIEEGAAVLMVMANNGVKGRAAGTGLAIVLRELQTKAIGAKDAWEKYNVAAYDSDGNMRNMADIIRDLEGALGGMSDEQQRVILGELGFTDRSMGFIQALLGQSDAIAAYEEQLRKAAGTTEEVAEKQLDTFASQLEIMWHKIQDVGISIGEHLLPAARDAAEAFGNWVDENHDLIVSLAVGVFDAIGKAAGAIGDLIVFVGNLIDEMQPLFNWISDIMWVLKHLDAYAGTDGPFGVLADTLMPLIEVMEDTAYWIGAIIDNLGDLEGFIGDDSPIGHFATIVYGVGDAFDHLVNDVIPSVVSAVQPLTDEVFYYLGQRVEWLTDDIFPQLEDLWDNLVEETAPKLGEAMDFLAEEVFPALGEAVQWFVDNPVKGLQDAMTSFLEWTNDNWPKIQETITLALEVVGEAFGLLSEVVGTTMVLFWEVIGPVIDTLFPDFGEAGEDLLTVLQIVFTGMKLGIQAVRFVFETEIALIKTFIDGLVWIINRVIDGLNLIISAANAITGTNSPLIPKIGETIRTWQGTFGKDGSGIVPGTKPAPSGTSGSPTASFGPVRQGGSGGVRFSAVGTTNFPGGWSWVGEQGPELMRFPSGTQIMSNQMSRMFAERSGGGGEVHKHYHVTVEGNLADVDDAEDVLEVLQRLDYLERQQQARSNR